MTWQGLNMSGLSRFETSWEYLGILNLKSGNSTYHAEDLPPGKPRGVSQVAIDPSAQYGLAKRLQI